MSSPAARGRRNIQRMAKIINSTLEKSTVKPEIKTRAEPILDNEVRVAPIVHFCMDEAKYVHELKTEIQKNVFAFLKDKRMTRHGPV